MLHVAFVAPENGFDPQATSDLYSNYVNRADLRSALSCTTIWRGRTRVVPNTAEALPEISADGMTWTIRIKPGIYFSDDPAFKGKKRELVADDYVYSFKRLIDPKLRSNNAQILDDRLVGAQAMIEAEKKTGMFDYDARLEGAQAIDRYTLRLKLNFPAYDLLADLTGSSTAAVAREVVKTYGDASGWIMEHPVGTGPYRLDEWRRGQKIVLEASPSFRDEAYPESAQPDDRALEATMRGKKAARHRARRDQHHRGIASRACWRSKTGELDYITVPTDLVPKVLNGDKLKPEFAASGILLGRGVQPAIVYTYFNMDDPVVGGYTNDKIALRRAISMAYNIEDEINVIRLGQAMRGDAADPAQRRRPRSRLSRAARTYDVAGAKALLDKFGYVDSDGDGWRDLPDGKPLKLTLRVRSVHHLPPVRRAVEEKHGRGRHPDRIHQAEVSRHAEAWHAPASCRCGVSPTPTRTTTAASFLDLLYGPHKGMSNLGALRPARIQRALRPREEAAERTRAREALPRDVEARRRLRALGAPHLPHREHHRASVGAGLQVQHVRSAPMDVPRYRSRATAERDALGAP